MLSLCKLCPPIKSHWPSFVHFLLHVGKVGRSSSSRAVFPPVLKSTSSFCVAYKIGLCKQNDRNNGVTCSQVARTLQLVRLLLAMRSLAPTNARRGVHACLLAIFVAVASAAALCGAQEPRHAQQLAALDAELADALAQVVGEQEALLLRFERSRELVERLFAREAAETRGFVAATRSRMLAVGDALRDEMRTAVAEVRDLLRDTARNATGEIHRHREMEIQQKVDQERKQQEVERKLQEERKKIAASRIVTAEPSDEEETVVDEAAMGWRELEAAVICGYEALSGASKQVVRVAEWCVGILALWLHVLVFQVLPLAAALLVLLALGAVAVVWIREYKRVKRRRPQVVYSDYLRMRKKNGGTKQNGKSRKLQRTRGDPCFGQQVEHD